MRPIIIAISASVYVCLILGVSALHAETDVLLRAVGFAVTGSDDAEPKAIDRAKCVFGVGRDVFRLNNIQVERIKIQGWKQTNAYGVREYVTVEIHGDEVVYETTTVPMTIDNSPITRSMMQSSPELFQPQHQKFKERTIGDL